MTKQLLDAKQLLTTKPLTTRPESQNEADTDGNGTSEGKNGASEGSALVDLAPSFTASILVGTGLSLGFTALSLRLTSYILILPG